MQKILHYYNSKLNDKQKDILKELTLFVGDIHNHCGISYGHGRVEDAIDFAKQQLDFFSITGHFAWPDMEKYKEMGIPKEVIGYHKQGFKKLRKNWGNYRELMNESANDDIVPFLSYEYHSFEFGDYTVVEKALTADLPAEIEEGYDDDRLSNLIKTNDPDLTDVLCFPHHIGYKQGYRGINWNLYNEKASPVVEIISMHGCSESHENPLRYLHTMGPRVNNQTMQGGLSKGYKFGVIGCTDHHNASPGSYGFGRTGVWAEQKTRDSIWKNICDKHTIAYSGDPIEMALFVNDQFIGTSLKKTDTLKIDSYTCGFDGLDKVELISDGKIIYHKDFYDNEIESTEGWISLSFGWGKKNLNCKWNVEVEVIDGNLVEVLPRFRGEDIVAPLDKTDAKLTKPHLNKLNNLVKMDFCTTGNPTTVTDTSQGIALNIERNLNTKLKIKIKALWGDELINKEYIIDINEFKTPQSEYIKGFVSPVIEIGKFVSNENTKYNFSCELKDFKGSYIYQRVFQKNGDFAISSPIWIE